MHTTASDGRLSPALLVARVAAAGLTTISVTDHDTTAAFDAVVMAARAHRLDVVPGIEITAVDDGRDVHLLGYFFDITDAALARFLTSQRALRLDRAREMARRLDELGAPIDIEQIISTAAAVPGTSVSRPLLARALVDAGHVASAQEAFDRFLASGRPAFVPRVGPSPREVIEIVHRAHGIVSMAHPGVTKRPELIDPMIDDGLDAVEAYHSDHTPEVQAELLALAERRRICVSGGSDFHGDSELRRPLGGVVLPPEAFDRLSGAARARRPA